jgi:hypothetical protein
MPRPRYGFLLFDLPSDHEVDLALPTECELIHALLVNRRLGSRVKLIKASTSKRLEDLPAYQFQVQFVHLAGHGGPSGAGLIGGYIGWRRIARIVTSTLHRLSAGHQRILCISSCHSREGLKAMKPKLRGYFTGCYFFEHRKVSFATTLATWTMFYYRKELHRPHRRIVDRVNSFFGKEVLAFEDITNT